MSEGAVELGRQVLAVLSDRDFDRLVAMADEDVEWRSFFAELGQEGVYRGIDGMRRYVEDLNESWEFVHAEVDDGVAVGDVAVLVGRIHFRGRGSGAEDANPAGWMLKFREGKVVRFRAFRRPEEALEAVGTRL